VDPGTAKRPAEPGWQ